MGLDGRTVTAAGAYTSIGAAVAVIGQRGGAATYVGVGDCDITLDKGIDNTECAFLCTLLDAAADDHTVRAINDPAAPDTVKSILVETTAAGAAAEQAVNWVAVRFAP